MTIWNPFLVLSDLPILMYRNHKTGGSRHKYNRHRCVLLKAGRTTVEQTWFDMALSSNTCVCIMGSGMRRAEFDCDNNNKQFVKTSHCKKHV